ncbi:Na+/H+ antiporter [Staphylococcus aureus]|uniref:Na+/H+ antiporter n=1 Tax=Staphylococcus aureus TaxID=1280 RepID=A0A380DQK4_STAAU|nr:Na+/H+ antiporter [Staphylococcus aureus]
MALLEAFLIFIFAVIISSVINNRFPQIPTAFIQIALGVVIFIIPIQVDFQSILKYLCLPLSRHYFLWKVLTSLEQNY